MAGDAYDSPADESKVPLLPLASPSSEANPPPYQPASARSPTTHTAPARSASCSACLGAPPLKRVAPPLLPCNFYAVRRKGGGAVAGAMVVDPAARLPAHLLMPLPEGHTEADRANLAVAVPYDAVDIDVWIVGAPDDVAKPGPSSSTSRQQVPDGRVRINVEGLTAQLRLHDMGGRLCDLTVKGYSATRLALPRAFRGPLTLYTNGTAPEFSPAMRVNVTMFYEDDARKHHCKYVRKCFIGEYSAADQDPPKWTGSTVDVISQGSTYIYYEDETPPPPFTRWERFWHKLASFGPETPNDAE